MSASLTPVALTRGDVMVVATRVLSHVGATDWRPSPWMTVALIGLCREHQLDGLALALLGVLRHVAGEAVSRN